MKRIGALKESFFSYENLYLAFKKAYKSTKTKEANRFAFHLESSIFSLQEELINQSYQPTSYRYFTIYEPKERIISVAAFKDRVVHHALINILEPIYEKRFICDSYATRKNKGTHKAVLKAQGMLKQNSYYLKTDIKQYFPSICHETLKQIIRRTIKDRFMLDLCEQIIDIGGTDYSLPIGNSTSQFFANVYLNQFDYYLKDILKIKYYIRYMDDIVVFSNDKNQLIEWKAAISDFLKSKLRLSLKESQTMINTSLHGLSFLGLRVFPSLVRIKQDNLKRALKKIRLRQHQFIKASISQQSYDASMNSIISHFKYWKIDTTKLIIT